MNRGELPGYYWDQEKKRYFKIQANHLVPDGSKYSKGNVKQEKRLAKKRKVDERNRLKREKPVRSAPVLSAPIGILGLLQEQYGYPRLQQAFHQGEAALVSQWTAKHFQIRLQIRPEDVGNRLADAHYVPESQTMIVASQSQTVPGRALYSHDWDWEESCCPAADSIRIVAWLNAPLTSISTRVSDRGCLVITSAAYSNGPSVFAGIIPQRGADDSAHGAQGVHLAVGTRDRGTSCLDTAINAELEKAVVIGPAGIHVLDTIVMNVCSKLLHSDDPEWPGCDAGVSWLDPHIVLYGAKESRHSVMLWDTRTENGKKARFTVRDRLTGVFAPTLPGSNTHSNPHEILASTNHRINLFDIRMPRLDTRHEAPVLTFPHIHGGPKLHRAAKGSLVAAVDRDNIVQVYSLRSGMKVSSLSTPPWQHKKMESPTLRNLMWYDDPRQGSVLQAVRGNGVVRWAWGGDDDESSDERESD